MTTRSEPRAAAAAILVLALSGCTSSADGASGQGGGVARGPAARTFTATAGAFPVCDWAADGVAASRLGEVTTRTPAGQDARFPDAWECTLRLKDGARLRVSVQPRTDAADAAAELAARRRPATGSDSLRTVAVGDEAFSFSGFGVTGLTARRGSVVLDVVVAGQPPGEPLDGAALVPVARRLTATLGPVPVPAA